MTAADTPGRRRNSRRHLDGVEQRFCIVCRLIKGLCYRRNSLREGALNLLSSVLYFYFSTLLASFIFRASLCFTWSFISHHNSGDRPDLWPTTILQPSLAGQGSGAKAINHTPTIHVGGTQLRRSKEWKENMLWDWRETKSKSIHQWLEAPQSQKKKTHKAIISSMVINNTETLLMAMRHSAAGQNPSWCDYSAKIPPRTCIILRKYSGETQ